MAITVTDPPAFALCGKGNPIIFKAATDASTIYVTEGVKAQLKLNFSHPGGTYPIYNDGDTFILSWVGREIKFTFKRNPDNSGTQLPVPDGLSTSSWVYSVHYWISKNYWLRNTFNITTSGITIIFDAKNYGLDSILSLVSTLVYIEPLNNTAVVNQVRKSFFDILLHLERYDNTLNEWVTVADLSLVPDADLNVKFEISELLWPYTYSSFTFPQELVLINKITGPLIKYKLYMLERYVNNTNIYEYQAISYEYYKSALRGGLPKHRVANMEKEGINFLQELTTLKYFLTLHPVSKTISPVSFESLFFFIFDIDKSGYVKLCAKSYYSDATDNTTIVEELYGAKDYDIFEFITSPCKLNLEVPGKTLVKYEIWLADVYNNLLSEVRTYVLDYTYYSNYRQFIFINSLGCWDTARFTGVAKSKYEIERMSFIKDSPLDAAYTSNELEQNRASRGESYVVNSGWIKQQSYHEYLSSEMLVSEKVFELLLNDPTDADQGFQIRPIVIISKDSGKQEDNVFNHYFEIEYKYAHNDSFFHSDKAFKYPTGMLGDFNKAFESSFNK